MFRIQWFDHAMQLRQGFFFVVMLFTTSFGAAVGNYQSHTWPTSSDQNLIQFVTGTTQKVRIYVCTPSIIRISLDDRGTFTSTKDVLGKNVARSLFLYLVGSKKNVSNSPIFAND